MQFLAFFLQAQQPASNPIASFLPLIIIVGIFYFLVFMPMQKQTKQQAQLLSSLQGVGAGHLPCFSGERRRKEVGLP